MSMRSVVVALHVLLCCGATLAWFAALGARLLHRRRLHRPWGRAFVLLVAASTVLAVGLAAASRNSFGLVFALQPLVLSLSAAAQFHRQPGVRRVLGGVGLLVAAAVMAGFAGLLATRDLVDVAPFAVAGAVVGSLALGDLLDAGQPAWQAHGRRMLAAGWFYVAELLIFVWDPHPSLWAWSLAGLPPLLALGAMRWRPVNLAVPGARLG